MNKFKLHRNGGKLGQAMYFGGMCTKDGKIAREILKCAKIGRKVWTACDLLQRMFVKEIKKVLHNRISMPFY